MSHSSVRRWLEEHTLIEPSLLDGAGLVMVVAERLAAFGGSEPAYIAELNRSSDEVDRLIAGIAVPETWLFRYPRSYDLLLDHLQRRLAPGAPGYPSLSMLSIGCATGQEPYCMAMTALHAGWPAERVRIEGIDRNREFLRAAEIGEYGPASIRSEIPAWAVPFLHRRGDTIEIDAAVRAMVRLTRTDVTDPAGLGGAGSCDVVFCRNLLIYLNAAARERLLDSICAKLVPGGLLFVGHAEQVMRGVRRLRAVTAPHAFALEHVDGPPPAADRPLAARIVPTRPVVVHGRTPDRAASASASASRTEPKADPPESIETARDLADAGRMADSEIMIRAIIGRRGPSAAALELLGMIRMSVNDAEGAKRSFEQAVYLEPARSASLLQLALISERSGDDRRAAAYWDRARRTSVAGGTERRP